MQLAPEADCRLSESACQSFSLCVCSERLRLPHSRNGTRPTGQRKRPKREREKGRRDERKQAIPSFSFPLTAAGQQWCRSVFRCLFMILVQVLPSQRHRGCFMMTKMRTKGSGVEKNPLSAHNVSGFGRSFCYNHCLILDSPSLCSLLSVCVCIADAGSSHLPIVPHPLLINRIAQQGWRPPFCLPFCP